MAAAMAAVTATKTGDYGLKFARIAQNFAEFAFVAARYSDGADASGSGRKLVYVPMKFFDWFEMAGKPSLYTAWTIGTTQIQIGAWDQRNAALTR